MCFAFCIFKELQEARISAWLIAQDLGWGSGRGDDGGGAMARSQSSSKGVEASGVSSVG